MHRIALLLLCGFFTFAYSCDIRVQVLLDISKPMFFQFLLYNGTQTDVFKVVKRGDKRNFHFFGPECNKKPIELRVYKVMDDDTPSMKFEATSSFMEGIGEVNYYIIDGLSGPIPKMKSRMGVLCGFGDCGRGR